MFWDSCEASFSFESYIYYMYFLLNCRDWCWPGWLWGCIFISWGIVIFWQRAACYWQCEYIINTMLHLFVYNKHLSNVITFVCLLIWKKNKFPVYDLMALCVIFQILFICGLAFVIGLERTFRFFFQRHKLKGTGFFLGGILVVLFGWPVVGMVVETYGFVLLFG